MIGQLVDEGRRVQLWRCPGLPRGLMSIQDIPIVIASTKDRFETSIEKNRNLDREQPKQQKFIEISVRAQYSRLPSM
ncbi:hypothetical protein J6590_038910 [Homalodisca vitripennis]|nr:hypothetical protein J6590_038910 [Homalodisca vitripennis]